MCVGEGLDCCYCSYSNCKASVLTTKTLSMNLTAQKELVRAVDYYINVDDKTQCFFAMIHTTTSANASHSILWTLTSAQCFHSTRNSVVVVALNCRLRFTFRTSLVCVPLTRCYCYCCCCNWYYWLDALPSFCSFPPCVCFQRNQLPVEVSSHRNSASSSVLKPPNATPELIPTLPLGLIKATWIVWGLCYCLLNAIESRDFCLLKLVVLSSTIVVVLF